MNLRSITLVLAASLWTVPVQSQQPIRLTRGLVITKSTRIAPGTYRITAPESLDSAIITIRGDNITVDFSGSVLQGSPVDSDPDAGIGVAIKIDGGTNVRILRANVRGYKIGILARGTRNLELVESNLSYNWKPRLYSGIDHESLMDWLSHHNNDKDEWLRFGAAVYLSDVKGGNVRANRIVQGMEGLMLVRTDSMRIWNNVIEFNSGVGIALYRSSYNQIMHNHASYNVRGYSHGFYRRGQDSADLLLYEQSCHNIVAFNSMTHGGDGLFLWAGQSTMDTGQGGANDNLFYSNDFSYAPTNAMEATFSRNSFIGNIAHGSEYGLWGGYSFESTVIGNDFAHNRTGLAIEHGQSNVIRSNRFLEDSTAIRLWAIPEEPSDWGYPKHRDTRSRDYEITDNVFAWNRAALRLAQTMNARVANNSFVRVDSTVVIADSSRITAAGNDSSAAMTRLHSRDLTPPRPAWSPPRGIILPKKMAGGLDPANDRLAKRDRSAIIVDEWGPYDWLSPRLWPRDTSYLTPLPLRTLGPAGSWRVVERNNVAKLSSEKGHIGDTIVVTPSTGSENDWRVTLEYTGQSVMSPRGITTSKGAPYRFSYSRFDPIPMWNIAFYALADSVEPRTPLASLHTRRLDYVWYRPTIANVPQANFRITATSEVKLGPGSYLLRTISDDAIRVWVDDKLVIDNWKPHESMIDTAPISSGQHKLRVEYYQVGGWVELRVDVVQGKL